MYSDKLASAIKVAGKVLRENGETVALPFGSEYAIHLKNMHSVRVKVRVEIDGVDATKNTALILGPNESIDFERFLESGKLGAGLKFKFIERTKKIEDGPRGIGAEDGLIRIEYEFEKLPAPIETRTIIHEYHDHRRYPNYWCGGHPYIGYASSSVLNDGVQTTLTSTSGVGGTIRGASAGVPMNSATLNNVKATGAYDPMALQEDFYFSQNANDEAGGGSKVEALPRNDKGITVGGGVSDQTFTIGAWFPTDGVKHVMMLNLLGQVGEKKVEKPVTVKTKLSCPTCGTTNKHGSKFCKECGTGLTIV